MLDVSSYAMGAWVPPGAQARPIVHAITGAPHARAGGGDLDMAAMRRFAIERGGPALRALDFHDRARLLKALALYLTDRKAELYAVSDATGATARDHLFDVDGGIGTLFVYASKGRREMPEGHVLLDGGPEALGRAGTFLGQHVWTHRPGVAVQINAFNFPVWGMLEKLAPAILAGVPSLVKPATATSYVTEACVRMMLASGLLPEGAVQLISGGVGDLLDRLGPMDSVAFTGSAATARRLRGHAAFLDAGARFTAEQDSLNATILGPDVAPGSEEWDLFVREAHREMTVKAGQKCTAIRRLIVPGDRAEALARDLGARLEGTVLGDPKAEGVRMGALVGPDQRDDVLSAVDALRAEAELVAGGGDPAPVGDGAAGGSFMAPTLLMCADPDGAQIVHAREAFGPVATILPARDLAHAVALANRGGGSLVASCVTRDPGVARTVVAEAGAWHGRLYFHNADCAAEATGHGAPMPHMVHGGPGRAGGGEELGGLRAVTHHMQRTAVQGPPDLLTGVTGRWVPGSARTERGHPFRLRFGDLAPGTALTTEARVVTMEDIETFAAFTGDTFYAHLDEAAAARNPFFPGRVAHGYLILSFAAGLFVEPAEGPVLANTGLDALRFEAPVSPGDAIRVELTAMDRKGRTEDYGEVRWHARVLNQRDEGVATYELLTMVAR